MDFPTGLLMDFLKVLLVLMQDSLDSPQELYSPQERPGTVKVTSRVLESPQELITGVLESPQELIKGTLDLLTGRFKVVTLLLALGFLMGTQDLLMDPTEFVGLFQ